MLGALGLTVIQLGRGRRNGSLGRIDRCVSGFACSPLVPAASGIPTDLGAVEIILRLGDLLLEMKKPGEARVAYKVALTESPNRFDALWGAAQACKAEGDAPAARQYFSKLVDIADPAADRPELQEAKKNIAH